jgi:hypothetical protein
MRPSYAVAFLFLGAVMFLPEKAGFALPAIPAFNKLTISALCVFFGVLVKSRRRLTKARWPKPLVLLLSLLAFGALASVATNLDPVPCGRGFCFAILPHTSITFLLDYFFSLLIPFWVGMALFRTRNELRDLLKFLVGAGLLYSIFVLVESRLSPQFHTWVYGYMQHDWFQTLRSGGSYRPMVFMAHGLSLGLFLATCTVAAMGFVGARLKLFGFKAVIATVYLLAILAICRSLGAFIYGVCCLLLMAFTTARTQLRAAVVVCSIAILYPVLRATDLFPTKGLLELSSQYSAERAGSLGFRFFNEDILLERAIQKPVFGWGGFDRIRIYDQNSGDEISVTDGYWIILFSSRGAVGFIGFFGMLIFPIFLAYHRINLVPDEKTRILIACLALITTINIVDLIPNGLFTYLPLLFSGSLLGVVQGIPSIGASVRKRHGSTLRSPEKAAVPTGPAGGDLPEYQAYT